MSLAYFRRGAILLAASLTATAAAVAAGQAQQADGTRLPDAADASAAQSPSPPGGRVAIMALGHRGAKIAGQQLPQGATDSQPNGRGSEIRPYHAPPGQR